MLYAAIDIHKHAFQAAVLDPDSGEGVEQPFSADRDSLARWAEPWRGRVAAVAIEATTGWRAEQPPLFVQKVQFFNRQPTDTWER